jgi:hypothetical protein
VPGADGRARQPVVPAAGFVSAIERGAQGLDAWRLRLLADTLDVSPGWPLTGPDRALFDDAPGRPEPAPR